MSETEYEGSRTSPVEHKSVDVEHKPNQLPVHDVEAADEGAISPLKRNLQGRHMQMIAIGTSFLLEAGMSSIF